MKRQPPGSGSIKKYRNGYRLVVCQDGKYLNGPTVEKRSDARAAWEEKYHVARKPGQLTTLTDSFQALLRSSWFQGKSPTTRELERPILERFAAYYSTARRTIPVPKSVIEFIDAHGDLDEPYMIGMTRRTLEREWPKYLTDGQTFHKLRAGNAGLITYLTGSIQTAADILGHTSTTMTEKHYRGRRNHAIADGIESLTNAFTNSKDVK